MALSQTCLAPHACFNCRASNELLTCVKKEMGWFWCLLLYSCISSVTAAKIRLKLIREFGRNSHLRSVSTDLPAEKSPSQ